MILAGVTYRQLDHWDHKGWVSPSGQAADGRSSRRLYRTEEVVRMAAIAHFRACGLDIRVIGPLMATFVAPLDPDLLVVLTVGEPPSVARVREADLRASLSSTPCLRAVFDPAPLLRILSPTGSRSRRG